LVGGLVVCLVGLSAVRPFPEVIQAKRFELIGDDETVVGIWSASDTHVGLYMDQITISTEGGMSNVLLKGAGGQRARLAVAGSGGMLSIAGGEGKAKSEVYIAPFAMTIEGGKPEGKVMITPRLIDVPQLRVGGREL